MWIDNKSRIFSAHHDIRQGFPMVSLPAVITDEALAALGVYIVTIAAKPEYDATTQDCVATAPVLVGDRWVQGWSVIDKSPEDIAAATTKNRNDIRDAIQAMLDSESQSRGYDSINTACGWAGVLDDATALRAWGASCWTKATIIEQEVLEGARTRPTVAEVMAEMPRFVG